jgi:putative oligomerization/nucleic acid binding protein
MPFGRRRPLARAAVVGGGAYALGKRRARNEDDAAYEEEAAAAPEAQPSGLSTDAMQELEKLADLKDKGILTQSEFDEQKAKILDAS